VNRKSGISADGIFCFLIPALLPVYFSMIGRMYTSEIALLVLLPWLLAARSRILSEKVPFRILALALIWLLGQILTDLVRDTKFDDFARGWANIGFTITDFVAIFLLVNYRLHTLPILLLGLSVGQGLVTLTNPDVADIRWKMGGGDALVIAALAIAALPAATFTWSRRFAMIIFGIGSILSFLFNARNEAGRITVALIINFVQPRLRAKFTSTKQLARAMVAVLIAGLPVSFAILALYGALASSGLMGQEARMTYAMQSNTAFGPYGVLLGGRPEIIVSTQAIADRPIIGHGSWARSIYYYLKFNELASLGFDITQENTGDLKELYKERRGEPSIPTHSILTQAWVSAGIAGGIFWLYVLFLTVYAMVSTMFSRLPMSPLIFHVCLLFIWNIFFSPFGSDRRIEVAVAMTVVLTVLRAAQRSTVVIARARPMLPRSATYWRPRTYSHLRRHA
jgi:hypothetical protein